MNKSTNIALEADRHSRRTSLPMPYPDPEPYKQSRKDALARDPRTRENYDLYQSSARSRRLEYLPIKLDIENVSRCNFHCTMCVVSEWPGYQRAEDMSLEDFKNLIDSQYGLVEIKMQGLGEPLLGRDTFFDMVKYARSKHIWVRTTTNASLLHFQDNYKKLIDSGINEIQVSFDGATKETFESIRRGSKFELVVDNCKLINDYCNERDLLRTRMWALIQRSNVHEFFDFVDISAAMGFKRLTFSLDLHGWGPEWDESIARDNVENSITMEMAEEAVRRGQILGLEVTFWMQTSKYSTESPDTLCQWPFERAFVSSDMRIVPCCLISNPDVADFGDAHDFTGEWQSEAYNDFRQAHLEGRIPKLCRMCYIGKERKAIPVVEVKGPADGH